MTILTQMALKTLLDYDPEQGVFTRKVARGNGGRFKQGSVAGSRNCVNGYIEIWLNGKSYSAHRLAFLYMTGAFPPAGVDHIDLNRSNNCWVNLRLASQQQNNWNLPRSKANTSGFKGVSRRKDTGKWVARIRVGPRYLSLGCFDTPEKASAAYHQAAIQHRGAFARSA